MTIGIVTEPKSYTRKYLFKKLFKKYTIKPFSAKSNPFDLAVDVLPFSLASLDKMKSSKLEGIIKKQARLLQKKGASQYILSDGLFNLCTANGIDTADFANGKGKAVFLGLMPLCVRQMAKNTGIDLFGSGVCITDTKLDRISEYLMRELCFDTKKLCLCTKNLKAATALCERFCDETGLWTDICETLDFRCDIILDVDRCQIKFGNDLFVRGAGFGFDFCGYDICHTDVAALLPPQKLTPKEWVFEYYEK